MELIGTEIELCDAEGTFEVTYLDGLFNAKSKIGGFNLTFKILKYPHELTEDERNRVLDYNLAEVTTNDSVTIKDIFMQGEFIEELT